MISSISVIPDLIGDLQEKGVWRFKAARFIDPEHHDETENHFSDLDLDFLGAKKNEAGEEDSQ